MAPGLPALNSPFVDDFVLGDVNDIVQPAPGVDAGMRDLNNTLSNNRNAHLEDVQHTILDLKPELEGRPFVIMCPGPSLIDHDWIGGTKIPDNAVIVTVNRAVKIPTNPSIVFITERHTHKEWLRDDNGVLLPCIPETPLVTCVGSSKWLKKIWPAEKRFYLTMPWSEIPTDPRIASKLEGTTVFSCMITTVIAMDFARLMGAERIVLLGADFSMTASGNYYWDVHASQHPNRHDESILMVRDIHGCLRQTNPELLHHRNVTEGVAYQIERSAQIPVVNASMGGMLDWHVKHLSDAFDCGTIVDPESGMFCECD